MNGPPTFFFEVRDGLVLEAAFSMRQDELHTAAAEKRMVLLEDSLSVKLLARQRWIVHNKVESEEMDRRAPEKERVRLEKELEGASFLRRTLTRMSTRKVETDDSVWLTQSEKDQLLDDMDDESKV